MSINFTKPETFVIDSHAHMLSQYYKDIGSVVQAAADVKVKAMVIPAVNLATCQEAIDVANLSTNLFAAIGHHPHEANEYDARSEDRLYELAKSPKVVAIGETGLDFYYNLSTKDEQIRAFTSQLGIAKELNKPVIVHCRDAFDEIFDIITKVGHKLGVFHCFTGEPSMLEKIDELGFYISFSGIVTFPKSSQIQETARLMKIDKLLVETDCPYLTPVPYRGKPNEPKYILHTLAKIASLRNLSVDEMAEITSSNTIRLFSLPL